MKYLYLLFVSVLLYPSLALGAATTTSAVIESDVLRVGPNITITEPVSRDTLLLGADIQINAPVAGDVLAAGANIVINAPVAGDVRVAGGQITINSKVGGNVTVAGGQVSLTPASEVAGSVGVWSGQVRLAGVVSGDVYIQTGRGENIQIDPNAEIGGVLTYKAETENPALVSDTIAKDVVFVERPQPTAWLGGVGYFFRLVSLFGLLVVGLVIVSLAPNTLRRSMQAAVKNPKQNLGWGLLTLLATPVAIIFLLFTLIGWPLALLLGIGYFMVIFLSSIFTGLVVGDYIIRYIKKSDSHNVSLLWAMVLGVVVLWLLGQIPLVGFVIALVGGVWGVGMLVRLKWQTLRQLED